MQQKTVLLASFITRSELDSTLTKIKENFVIVNGRVFVLRNKADQDKLILTYNIFLDETSKIRFDAHVHGTINLQRKKETNTLYTLNALNEIVKSETGGILNSKHVINWPSYNNCVLITQRNKGLVKIDTELENIVNFATI